MMVGRELYKDPVEGKISGVCAGVANYFGLEVWLVRIIVISVTLLGGWFIVCLAYVALSLMLEKRPGSLYEDEGYDKTHTLKQRPWKQGEAPNELLRNLTSDLDKMESSVRRMEAYVVSDAHKVNREFKNL